MPHLQPPNHNKNVPKIIRHGRDLSPALPSLCPRPVSPYNRTENAAFELFGNGHAKFLLPSQLKKNIAISDRMESEPALPYPPTLDRPIAQILPNDVILNILSFMAFKDLCKLCCVCSEWHKMASSVIRRQYKMLAMGVRADSTTPILRYLEKILIPRDFGTLSMRKSIPSLTWDLKPLARVHLDLPLTGNDEIGDKSCTHFIQGIFQWLADTITELALDWIATQRISMAADEIQPTKGVLFRCVRALTLILRTDIPSGLEQQWAWFNPWQLHKLHLQIHESPYEQRRVDTAHLVEAIGTLNRCRHETCQLSVEVHCSTERALVAMLQCVRGEHQLHCLKIIYCGSADDRGLRINLSAAIEALSSESYGATVRRLGLRGIHLSNGPDDQLSVPAAVQFLRLSSCNMDSVQCLTDAIIANDLLGLEIYGNDGLVKHVYERHFEKLQTHFAHAQMDFRSPERVYICGEGS